MKNIFLVSMFALMSAAFIACSSDDETPAPATFELVNMESYDISELDEKDFVVSAIEFSTNSSWYVSADKMWVLFSTTEDGEFFNDLRGESGTHTIYMKITNDARGFETSTANVSFGYGSEVYAPIVISRDAKTHTTEVTDENGNMVEEIVIDATASATIAVKASYEYGFKSYPEWLSEPVLYEGSYILSILDEFVPYELSGNIVLGSIDGSIENVYPISYAGMAPTIARIDGDYTPGGWEIALDGKTFRTESSSLDGESEEILVENFIPYNVKCLNYDCSFICVNENSDGSISVAADSWLWAEVDAENAGAVSVYAKPFAAVNERSRKGYLFAVPTSMHGDFVAAINSAADAVTFVDEHIDYVLVEAKQKDIFAPDGFVITDATGAIVECSEESDEAMYSWVSSELSVTDVYTVDGVNGATWVVNTLITPEEGAPAFALYDADGSVPTRRWGSPKITLNADGYYEIKLKVPAASSFTKPMILRLHRNNVNIKALIFKPVNN